MPADEMSVRLRSRAVERTAPLAMLLYSLIVIWFVREGHRSYRKANRPWYRTKRQPAFADMLTTLRRATVRENILSQPPIGLGNRKLIQTLENIAAIAV